MFADITALAIRSAVNRDWKKAIKLNKQILTYQPGSTEALNRLAMAHYQLCQPKMAKSYYHQTLKLDSSNPIAKKNLQKLKLFSSRKISQKDQDRSPATTLFIEEPMKTTTVDLVRLTSANYLAQLTPGDKLDSHQLGNQICLKHHLRTIGRLPDKLGFRLSKLTKSGNHYCFIIKAVDIKNVSVFIRETFQSKKNILQPSFPSNLDNQLFSP